MTTPIGGRAVTTGWGLLLAVFSVLALGGCGKRPAAPSERDKPLTLLSAATQQASAAQYWAEYDTAVSLTLNGQSRSETWRQVVMQAGQRRRADTYVRGIVLVQSLLENEQGQFMCAYVANLDRPQCLRLERAAGGALFDGLRYAMEQGLVTLETHSETAQIEDVARSCQHFDYAMHVDQMSPEKLQGLLHAAWPQQPSANITPEADSGIQAITGSFCLDKELGIPLMTSVNLAYRSGEADHLMEAIIQTTQTITWLMPTPLLSDEEFRLPDAAEVLPASVGE